MNITFERTDLHLAPNIPRQVVKFRYGDLFDTQCVSSVVAFLLSVDTITEMTVSLTKQGNYRHRSKITDMTVLWTDGIMHENDIFVITIESKFKRTIKHLKLAAKLYSTHSYINISTKNWESCELVPPKLSENGVLNAEIGGPVFLCAPDSITGKPLIMLKYDKIGIVCATITGRTKCRSIKKVVFNIGPKMQISVLVEDGVFSGYFGGLDFKMKKDSVLIVKSDVLLSKLDVRFLMLNGDKVGSLKSGPPKPPEVTNIYNVHNTRKPQSLISFTSLPPTKVYYDRPVAVKILGAFNTDSRCLLEIVAPRTPSWVYSTSWGNTIDVEKDIKWVSSEDNIYSSLECSSNGWNASMEYSVFFY